MRVPPTGLFVAPCSREAALWAVRAYHYSRTLPSGRALYFGVWFDGAFIGVVVVSRGACAFIARPFDSTQDKTAEVTRIALKPGHVVPVSQVLAVVVRLLRHSNPRLELLVSYSDTRQNHHGGIYQGSNWTYLGETAREATLFIHGREVHARTVSSKYGTRDVRWLKANVDPNAARIDCPPKYKYALGLTSAMRERLALLAKPYPKALVECGRGAGQRHARALAGGVSFPGGGIHREGALQYDPAAPFFTRAYV